MRNLLSFPLLLVALFPSAVVACNELSFDTPWVRQPPPVSRVAAGYVSIRNPSNKGIQIIGVQSECCEKLMIHETTFDQGVSKMRHLDRILVPPQSQIDLAPHGMHLMLINPIDALASMQPVDITFACDDGGEINVSFPVEKKQPIP